MNVDALAESVQENLSMSDSNSSVSRMTSFPAASGEAFHFSEVENEQLRRFPNKEYLVDGPAQEIELLSGLADILFGFAYDQRLTQADMT